MAIDSHTPPTTPAPGPAASVAVSAIENEFPTYRAISPMAIVSVLFGLLSILSFADGVFLVAALVAVLAGFYADWTIKRLPDVLTGRRLAQAGAALGLIFGLSAITSEQVQSLIRHDQAMKFAKHYVELIKHKPLADCMWYRLPPEMRSDLTPEQVIERLQKNSGDTSMFTQQTYAVQTMKDVLLRPGGTLTVAEIERHGMNGLNPFALALLRLSGPASDASPAKEEFALLILKGEKVGRGIEWTIEDITYPYKPKSYVIKAKPVDDGHGHGGH
ncbi:MAG TPA: hypothetical protein VGZ22_11830 [Isosphaeraceae bacterium]|nr:hypothetical protein [Isosphaeraceae bacterium]